MRDGPGLRRLSFRRLEPRDEWVKVAAEWGAPPFPLAQSPRVAMHVDDDDRWRDSISAAAGPSTTNGAHPPRPPGRPPVRLVNGGRDARPDIPITPDIHEVTAKMAEALLADPELYQRGGALTHVIRHDGGDDAVAVAAGSPISRTCPLSWLVDRVSIHARCIKRRQNQRGEVSHVHIPPPKESVRAVSERGSWPGVRHLRAILEAPSLRPDGSVIQDAGFDAATGCLYVPNETFLPVPEAPSHSDAVAAFVRLCEPFSDFPYVSEAHRCAAVAAVLTLLARPAIAGAVPAFVFDASAARSGKSLQVDVITAIATGRMASRMTYPETDEELEKVIAGYALRGSASVNFDNVARRFGGAALDKVITAVDQVDLRVLGATDLRTFDWRAVVFASGNNVAFKGDMLARVLSPRLETHLDNPETRKDFRHPHLREWVKCMRPALVASALTILRAYVVAGSPDVGCPRWGGFEAWSRLIPHALVWVGAADPMGARRGLEGDEDEDRVCSHAIVDGWSRLLRERSAEAGGMSIKGALSILYPTRKAHDPQEPDTHDDFREAIETMTNAKPGFPPSAASFGYVVRRLKGRPFGGWRLVSVPGHAGVAKWRVVKA